MATEPEIIVAGVALAISVIALAAAALQVTQQYYASANGYNACDQRVLGDWSRSRKRTLKLKEFRFEVQYESPVIFLTRPDYAGKGPVEGKPVLKLTGDVKSRKESWTEEAAPALNDASDGDNKDRRARKAAEKKEIEAIHTADNDTVTWVKLLQTIQNMESKSSAWQEIWFAKGGRPKSGSVATEAQKEAVKGNQTLIVAMQKKTKSYDTMPAGIKKPYGTSTWCHLIELIAMLGIYWVEFDRTNDRYRAEGNGFVVAGEKVTDLGVMFSFQVARASRFEENRVIPTEHVKDLAFGMVSTVYSRPSITVDRRLNIGDRQDISMLSFSSRADIAESLVLIGCNANAVNYFARDDHLNKRVTHLFPLAFEIIGMLAKTFHIEHSGFRYLPNPTMYTYSKKNFSLRDILVGYMDQVAKLTHSRSNLVKALEQHGSAILGHIDADAATGWPSFATLQALHDALKDTDVVLTAGQRPLQRPKGPSRMTTQLSGPISRPTNGFTSQKNAKATAEHSNAPAGQSKPPVDVAETERQKARRKMVQDVLRSHIQEVLSGLNQPKSPSASTAGSGSAASGSADDGISFANRVPCFDDIDSATPEEKQGKLMQVYFQVIRTKVVKNAQNSERRRRESVATISPSHQQPQYPLVGGFGPLLNGLRRRKTDRTLDETVELGPDEQPVHGADIADQENEFSTYEKDTLAELGHLDVSPEDIWCTLVFRMICWLMLHDFDQMDVQKQKKELHGSRLRVYIA